MLESPSYIILKTALTLIVPEKRFKDGNLIHIHNNVKLETWPIVI